MASLRKLPNCRNWIACFTRADGRRAQRSTGERDRKKAQRIADAFEDAARKRQTARQVHRVISELYGQITGDALPTATARKYFETWLDRKEPEISPSTNAFYRTKTRAFLAFLGEKADQELNRIGQADLLAFRTAESARVSATSVNHGLKFLRMVFKSARADGVLIDNPAEFVGTLTNRNRTQRRAFTLPELKALLAQCDTEWRSLIFFGLYTGQRLGDLAALTWQNVDVARQEIRIETAKTGRRQIIPIAAPLMREIENRPGTDDPKAPLHPRAFDVLAREGRVGTLSRQFYEIMADAGLVAKKPHRKQTDKAGRDGRKAVSEISFHALRHTATSLMKNAGISPAIVQEFIGHESEAVNRAYTHIETAAMKRAADALPDLASI